MEQFIITSQGATQEMSQNTLWNMKTKLTWQVLKV